ncbi:sulfotransferase [Sphingobium sp. 22B]|uniref:tetratricopeptide repeat-containing sulfotransferase family protein n=1 Tax=unclassified Sphingobium TaxID=2611147 RepID=UPI0007833E58|nr:MULTISPECIES: tetratricopeptide repeat-containing sulfotransferase family protein [unclassified Sphingobium]KXU33756.1 sulfotransferase [Sphingobium sp. AM]KYC33701.1 sulfotransferase [Sphingobium sp. 22B]OAP33442.1 sulfotransferase [Sphingobium sp. 20006FA]
MMAARSGQAIAARSALARGDIDATQRLAATLVSENPGDAEGHFLLGVAESSIGRVHAGIQHLGRAVELDPQGEYRAQLAKLFTLVRQDGDAAAVLQDAEHALPADALSRDTMGCVYARLGDHPAALGHFSAAVRLEPGNRQFRYNQAVTLNFLGRTEEAEAALEALIALAPDDARAHHLLSSLRKQSAGHNHVERLAKVHSATGDGRGRLLLGYALAKELEDLSRPEEALERLCAVNAEHRRTLRYEFARDAATFDAIEASWPSIAAAPADDAPRDAPIFIIGMPRTGTTLVDRILSSHPDVESAGELQAMPLAVKKAAGTRTPTVLDPETIATAAASDMGTIGRDFLQRASHHRRDPGRRFIDKFPGNFHYAGFIARALPAANIVCLRRHPMDTVLSNFRNLFAVNSRYYDYSYDLLEIAAYYVRFDRLMALWREVLPGRVIELRYEDLVADQEGQSRRLLAHCGLEWADECLSFHTNDAPVSTPSAAQVRRPIYRDAVARWKRHEQVLEPVRRFFERSGISID